jgi:hypothetical protein
MYESSYGGTSGKVVAVDSSQAMSIRSAAAFLTDHVTERCTAEDPMEDIHWEDLWQMAQALTGEQNVEGQRKLADVRQRRQEAFLHSPTTVHDVEDVAEETTGGNPLPATKKEEETEEQVNLVKSEEEEDDDDDDDDGVNKKSKKEAKKRKKEEKKTKKEAKRARKEAKKKKKKESSDA